MYHHGELLPLEWARDDQRDAGSSHVGNEQSWERWISVQATMRRFGVIMILLETIGSVF